MRVALALAAVVTLTGCTTAVLEMHPPGPGAELWGRRTLVVADLGDAGGYQRDAEESLAELIPGAVSAEALEAGAAGFEGEDEEDRATWDTIVGVDLLDERGWSFQSPEADEVAFAPYHATADFRVSVVRRADGRELVSMVIRSSARDVGFGELLAKAVQRAGKELTKTGLFR